MSLTSRLSQLRNRHSKEPTQPPANPDTASSSGSDPSSSNRTKSIGSLDDWTDISSMDAVSMGSSSQPEAATCSKDDGSTNESQVKPKTKSSLGAPSSEHVLLAVDTDAVLKRSPRPSSGSEDWDKDQRRVYEQQLENLQEQLVDIMIENQTLAQKLQRYENSDVIPLLKKLEEETERNENLTQRCCVLEKRVKDNRIPPSRQVSADDLGLDATELVSSSSDEFDGPPPSRLERLQNYVMESVYNIIGDFTEEGEETDSEETSENDELTVKRLKENLKRFKSACDPCVSFFKAVSALVSWKSSSTTFLVFLFYMYAVWRGWTMTVLLGMMIWYLSTTYFISMGWTIEFSLLPYHLIEVTPDEGPPLSMSDRFQLVLHVCRKVQNLLSYLADILEKLYNFLYWTNPDLTKKIYTNLVIAFIASLFLNGSTIMSLAGLFIGVKVFLMDPVLERYPRLKDKYSTARKILREVPTNAELEHRRAIEETEQFLIPDIEGITIRLADHESLDAKPASKRWKTFSQSFNLPQSEQPLPGWEDGRRCTMITKHTVKGAFRNGRLYLTKSFLCFEKSRLLKEGNMIIPLKDVTGIEKAKPFGFFPGSGMSIEIHLLGLDQPILFGGILHRNTVHEKITRVWEAAQTAIQLQNNQQAGVEREGTGGEGGTTSEERRGQREEEGAGGAEGAEGGGVGRRGGGGGVANSGGIGGGRGGGGRRKEKQDIKNEEEEEEEVLEENIEDILGRHPEWATC